ncbi:hypothetical protein L210DRAFT_331567 [Boletus edulis BED1]|uniref:Uncharacterized protein n=1 Tax=Boletus edulis BED1 TaxID=1328754 RepID=A0AAD4B9L6_BOLED|nr:hypothetical protein L210DRAFT_331567 [Boletus edulis BED1]
MLSRAKPSQAMRQPYLCTWRCGLFQRWLFQHDVILSSPLRCRDQCWVFSASLLPLLVGLVTSPPCTRPRSSNLRQPCRMGEGARQSRTNCRMYICGSFAFPRASGRTSPRSHPVLLKSQVQSASSTEQVIKDWGRLPWRVLVMQFRK